MQDSEKDYPSQPMQSRHRHHSVNDANVEGDNTELEPAEIRLPPNGLLYAIVVGILGGLIAAFIPVAITIMNTSLYHEASRLGDKMSTSTAWTITELGCLGIFIALVLSFVVGYIVGHVAVLRRRGLLAGALVGAITSLGGFIVHSLPDYPDKIVPTTPLPSGAVFTGILTILLVLVVYSAIGALIALWGTWTATRAHPYYQLQMQE